MSKQLWDFEKFKTCLLNERIEDAERKLNSLAYEASYVFNQGGVEERESSEIERLFCLAFMYIGKINNLNDMPVHSIHNPAYAQFRIEKEFQVGKYRTDFMCQYEKLDLGKCTQSDAKVLVECDSQQWHETTEKQRRYEKKRERFIQGQGFHILRFTGRELMENPIQCAQEVVNYLRENLRVVKS